MILFEIFEEKHFVLSIFIISFIYVLIIYILNLLTFVFRLNYYNCYLSVISKIGKTFISGNILYFKLLLLNESN